MASVFLYLTTSIVPKLNYKYKSKDDELDTAFETNIRAFLCFWRIGKGGVSYTTVFDTPYLEEQIKFLT